MAVRLRVDGILYPLTEIGEELKRGVISRIKILGDMDIADKRLPQDGRATFRSEEGPSTFVSPSIPTVHGENVTIRLSTTGRRSHAGGTGMADDELAIFRKAIKRPWGEVLVTGPTGSGKSTTLYAGLEELNSPSQDLHGGRSGGAPHTRGAAVSGAREHRAHLCLAAPVPGAQRPRHHHGRGDP